MTNTQCGISRLNSSCAYMRVWDGVLWRREIIIVPLDETKVLFQICQTQMVSIGHSLTGEKSGIVILSGIIEFKYLWDIHIQFLPLLIWNQAINASLDVLFGYQYLPYDIIQTVTKISFLLLVIQYQIVKVIYFCNRIIYKSYSD